MTYYCCDCGKELFGIHQARVRKNPDRRCMDCHLARCSGKYMHALGYVVVIVGHGRDAKKKLEHRLVMERKLGRKLRAGEVVHHINHNRADNREENLRLYDNPGIHVIAEGHISRRPDGTFGRPSRSQKGAQA